MLVLDSKKGLYKITDLGLDDIAHGLPGFTAPEVVRDKVYDEKSDCYSIGAIIYQAVYGKIACKLREDVPPD